MYQNHRPNKVLTLFAKSCIPSSTFNAHILSINNYISLLLILYFYRVESYYILLKVILLFYLYNNLKYLNS